MHSLKKSRDIVETYISFAKEPYKRGIVETLCRHSIPPYESIHVDLIAYISFAKEPYKRGIVNTLCRHSIPLYESIHVDLIAYISFAK